MSCYFQPWDALQPLRHSNRCCTNFNLQKMLNTKTFNMQYWLTWKRCLVRASTCGFWCRFKEDMLIGSFISVITKQITRKYHNMKNIGHPCQRKCNTKPWIIIHNVDVLSTPICGGHSLFLVVLLGLHVGGI